jgi:Heavy metal associated domain 2
MDTALLDAALRDGVVEHMIQGRIRLRFRSRQGDVAFFEQLVKLLSNVPAVEEIEANPGTGSVLIRHTATPEELAFFAAQYALFGGDDSPSPESERKLSPSAESSPAKGAAPSLPTLGLSTLGLYQLARGSVLGSATQEFWHATQVSQRNAPLLALVLFGFGVLQLVSGRILAPASSLFVYAFMTQAIKAPRAADPSAQRRT